MSPRCAALAESMTPQGRRALASFLDGRLPAGQLHDELLRALAAGAHADEPVVGAEFLAARVVELDELAVTHDREHMTVQSA